uniref:hypothetical protein n=1 Tax=Clostridium sp. NkU-1 TaxID=1095009 RepID=UPI0006D21118
MHTGHEASFLKISRLGVAAAVTMDGTGKVALSSWRLNGLLGDLLDTGLITRRIFAPWLNDRPELKADSKKERYVYVDAVPGSLFMADIYASWNAVFMMKRSFYIMRKRFSDFS